MDTKASQRDFPEHQVGASPYRNQDVFLNNLSKKIIVENANIFYTHIV